MNLIISLASSYLLLKISHRGDSGIFFLNMKIGITPKAPIKN